MRPFRFGVSMLVAKDRREWRRKARRAEALGYDVLLVPDHVANILPPLAALTTAAEATKKLRVGTFVLNNDFHHPVFIARDAATIDVMTDGRFELGVGAGHMKSEYDEIGLPFDPPRVRVRRMRESVALLRSLLDGNVATLDGEYYHVHDHVVFPKPKQDHVPILVGGNGRLVLTTAAQYADIVGFTGFSQVEGTKDVDLSHFTTAAIQKRIALVREAAGERFDDLELNALLQFVEVTNDRRAAVSTFTDRLGMNVDDALDSPFILTGTSEQMAETLREHRERLGLSYFVVSERLMEPFATVIQLLR